MGHVRRAPQPRLRDGQGNGAGRRRGHGLRHDQRPAGVRLLAGLHGIRRVAVGGPRREDLQGHGPRDQGGRAGDRPQRLGRRAHPGRRRLARRLCRSVPAQRAGVWRDPADLAHHGPLRRRRRVLARDDRLHLHGEGLVVHVRDRSRGREDRHPRGGDRGRAGRWRHAYHALGGGRPRVRQRRRGAAHGAPAVQLPAAVQSRAAAVAADQRSRRPARDVARHAGARQPEQAVRHQGAHRQDGRRRRVLRAFSRTTPRTS